MAKSTDTPVKDLIKNRKAKPTPGAWCAGFTACKKYAINNNVPLITAVVSGDGCGYCKRFAAASTEGKFKTWMAEAGYIFWFGSQAYCKGEDGYKGAGWNWCYDKGGGTYPGCRVYWEVNGKVKVDTFRNGESLAKKSKASEQAQTNIDIFSKILKDYKPTPPEPVKYTVTFDPNGGTLDSASMTRTVAEGEKVGDLPAATRDGYAFNGWWTAKEGGTEISSQQTVTTNVTYYARWTKIPDGGGGSGGGSSGDQPQPPADPDKPLKSMFGLCKDCVIITKDNKILKYSAGEQAITLVGDYAPTALFATAKNIT